MHLFFFSLSLSAEVSMPGGTYFFDFLTQLRGHDKSKFGVDLFVLVYGS